MTCSLQGFQPVAAGIYSGGELGQSSNLCIHRRVTWAGPGSPCLPQWPHNCSAEARAGQEEMKHRDTRGDCPQLSVVETSSSTV